MINIKFKPSGKTIAVEDGTTIAQAAIAAGLLIDQPCGGRGVCEKCKVTIYENGVTREVLACQTEVHTDLTADLSGNVSGHRILIGGISRAVTLNPGTTGKYAMAYDIGTTTVASYLLDLRTGAELCTASALNPQTKYGGDVIARINYSLEHGVDALTNDIRGAMVNLARQCAASANIAADEIALITIVGNTTMHHLFRGLTTETLAFAPYHAKETDARTLAAADCGFDGICPNAVVKMFPNMAGFVGGDTVGAALAAAMDSADELTLLIDIGTNGEMVLGDRNRLVTCSTAAGPAFEGAMISQGMRGADGAIDHAELTKSPDGKITVDYTVIGGGPAIGVCGSGLIDVLSELVRTGLVDETGKLDGDAFEIAPGVSVTAKDIRQLQLAKGAMAAGIEMLRNRLNVQERDIKRILIAGAFGSYMNPASARGIGLIPPLPLELVHAIGNAAGQGAKLAALNIDEYERAKRLAEKMEYLELSANPDFNDIFIDHLSFDPLDVQNAS
ncbi:MAG: ASKHA domain-containing protein [Oscillospiraceae bacterium]|jgi:uncharacterized 2Fe-2S/4Fe-4S cluster protein (DUF4445 family)|nr:ASKHA domain-containing protein [Oscillospiraceae bacterium]